MRIRGLFIPLLLSCSQSKPSQFGIPWFAVRSNEHFGGFGIAKDRFVVGVPADFALCLKRDIGQVADGGDAVAALEIGVGLLAGLDAVEEIAGVLQPPSPP